MMIRITSWLYKSRYTILVFLVLLYRSSSLTWIKQSLGVNACKPRVVETRASGHVDQAGLFGCADPYEGGGDGCSDPYEDEDEDDYGYDDGCSGCEADYEPASQDEYDDGCSGCETEYESGAYYEEEYDDGCAGCYSGGSTTGPVAPVIQKTVRFSFTVQISTTILLRISGVNNSFDKVLASGTREPDIYDVEWYGYLDRDSAGNRISKGTYRATLAIGSQTWVRSIYYSEQYGFETGHVVFN